MSIKPGTVSEVLWHFTGGPRWDANTGRQEDKPKPDEDAYAALLGILTSKQLRIGRSPELSRWSTKGLVKNESGIFAEAEIQHQLTTSKVCCLADIPEEHLDYHAFRYGRFAIGFKRDSAIKADFNPVLYSLEESKVVSSQFATLITLLQEFNPEEKGPITKKQWNYVTNHLMHMASFTKTFHSEEFPTIYCEREWRSTKSFDFDYSDLQKIVLPSKCVTDFYRRFLSEPLFKVLQGGVEVMAWESLKK